MPMARSSALASTATSKAPNPHTWTQFAAAAWFGWPTPPPEGPPPAAWLRRIGLAAWVGQALAQRRDPRAAVLKPDVERTLLHNAFALVKLYECLQLWRSHGIEALPLKGAAFLLAHGRKATAVRPMSDLDVLVRPAQYQRAAELLGQHGFAPRSVRSDPMTAVLSNESTWLCKIGSLTVAIDLHRRFGAWPTLRPVAKITRLEQYPGTKSLLPTKVAVAIIGIAHRARCPGRADARELLDIFSAWSDMTSAEVERFGACIDMAGLHRQLDVCWREVLELFRPPASSMSALQYLVSSNAQAASPHRTRSRPWQQWQSNAIERFGYGSPVELAIAGVLYASARIVDRVLFRRGSSRIERLRKPPAEELRHYWQRDPESTQ